MTSPAAPPDRHSLFEDALALIIGVMFIALGVTLFSQTGMLTGGTAGIAFLLHYATGQSFGKLFFLINLPFYWLAWKHMAPVFTVKTFLAVGLLSLFSVYHPLAIQIQSVHPLYAALMGGMLLGTGFLILFRHHASLGGVGIVALILQQQRGWRAGRIQMAVDCAIVLAAFFLVDVERLLYSLVGAVALNTVLAVNHKPGRYLGM